MLLSISAACAYYSQSNFSFLPLCRVVEMRLSRPAGVACVAFLFSIAAASFLYGSRSFEVAEEGRAKLGSNAALVTLIQPILATPATSLPLPVTHSRGNMEDQLQATPADTPRGSMASAADSPPRAAFSEAPKGLTSLRGSSPLRGEEADGGGAQTMGPMLPDDIEASKAAAAYEAELLGRLLPQPNGAPREDYSPARAERIQLEIRKLRETFAKSTIKLENSTEPLLRLREDLRRIEHTDSATGATETQPPGSILYVVLTGNRSHGRRVKGIDRTLGQIRPVLWYSDAADPVIDPVVLASSFEDNVCMVDGLVVDTQLKGCRYQRGFYRSLMLLADVVSRLGLTDRPTNFSGPSLAARGVPHASAVQWVVRLADDTMVIPQHLEQFLLSQAKGDAAKTASIVAGHNETRSTYWFFSGGHPVAYSVGALRRIATDLLHQCEGIVIDFGGKKLEKFWWWADDVLVSLCLRHLASTAALFTVVELPGCFSAPHFGKFVFPQRLWQKIPIDVRVQVQASAVASKNGRRKEKEHYSWITQQVFPSSYHTYPYITAYQMFGLYNRLFVNSTSNESLRRLLTVR